MRPAVQKIVLTGGAIATVDGRARAVGELARAAGIATAREHVALPGECLDWTERRQHFGAAPAAGPRRHAVGGGWLTRQPHRPVRGRRSEPSTSPGVEDAVLAGAVRS